MHGLSFAEDTLFDLLIIGGGINGAGIARDAAGRGLKVLLVEKDDLAQGTSSRSGKLIHGGLRYLEYYKFRLVREALVEREVLLRTAPHIIWPMRFVLPHYVGLRSRWMVQFGLFLYDHMGGRKKLPGTRVLDLYQDGAGAALRPEFRFAFEYSDCWVDDSRLVIITALDAVRNGTSVVTRTAFVAANRKEIHGEVVWQVSLTDFRGKSHNVLAKVLVNAAGPWVEDVISKAGLKSRLRIRLVKGSHIILPKFWEGQHAYLIQNDDKRVIFINPYEGCMALIGTTDIPFSGNADSVVIDAQEIDYLLHALNRYFKRTLTPHDVITSFSGVRPLCDDASKDASAVTRDYLFELDLDDRGQAPILSVFGGKITTFRKLAEHALTKLRPFFSAMGNAWTKDAPLPGGDILNADFDLWRAELARRYPALPEALRLHYGRLYGSNAPIVLGQAVTTSDLGYHFGGLLYERELEYLVTSEFATTVDDILWRRTKHGLHLKESEQSAVKRWIS